MSRAGRKRQPSESRRTTLMALLTFGFIFVVVVIFVIRPTTGVPSQANEGPAAGADGQLLFETYCAACHGVNGEAGVVPNALPLNADGETWRLSDEEIIQMIRVGNEQMPAMGSDFTDEQVESVVGHIKSWWTPEQRAIQTGDIGE